MKKWLFIGLLLISAWANAAIQLGKDYKVLETPQPVSDQKKIEVIEFFSYSCIHCMHFDPYITAWLKTKPADVVFRKEHIVWQPQMKGLAQMFATFQVTNTLPILNGRAFDAVMNQRQNLANPKVFADWIKKQPGVDATKIMQTYQSFGINTKVAHAEQVTRAYNIQATPTLVVNGRYQIEPVTPERTIAVLNELINKIRKEKQGK